jgi:hypothetical protein
MLDCIYVTASARDSRFTRICVASVRYFHPEVPVRLLAGGHLPAGLAKELLQYWDVQKAHFAIGEYGWGFVKLEPLFGAPGEKFLMLDSDTALTGPVLNGWKNCDAQFLVDNEKYCETNIRARYYDWQKLLEIDRKALAPRFVFNSGQWVGTAGVLTRDDFEPWLEWTFPRRLRYPNHFFPGEQGILNYVLNRKAILGEVSIESRSIMRWAGHGLSGLDVKAVSEGTAPALIIHWAGMKKVRHGAMVGADLLSYFEGIYYRRLPCKWARRMLAVCQDALIHFFHGAEVRVKLAFRKYMLER